MATAKQVEINGRTGWQSVLAKPQGQRYFYFNIQDPLLKNGNAQEVTISLTYLDKGNVSLFLQYDSSDKSVKHKRGAGVWKRGEMFLRLKSDSVAVPLGPSYKLFTII